MNRSINCSIYPLSPNGGEEWGEGELIFEQ